MPPPSFDTVVFDLGGVLIDWNPRHLYRRLFDGDEARVESFLARVCTQAWNEQQDAGRTFAEGVALLVREFPHERAAIEAYDARWEEMIPKPVPGTVAVLEDLRRAGVRTFALSNWSKEKFPLARRRFSFLETLDGIVISGEVGFIKPDPRIFDVLVARHGVVPGRSIFVDDHAPNVDAARALGFSGLRFIDAPALRLALDALGVPVASGAP